MTTTNPRVNLNHYIHEQLFKALIYTLEGYLLEPVFASISFIKSKSTRE